MLKDKKAQTTMEFLANYGWALLAMAAILGALAYFGVFSARQYVPNACVFQSGISCVQSTGFYDNAKKRTYAVAELSPKATVPTKYSATVNVTGKDWKGKCFITTKEGDKDWEVRVLPEQNIIVYCYVNAKPKDEEPVRFEITLNMTPDNKYLRRSHGYIMTKITEGTAPDDPP